MNSVDVNPMEDFTQADIAAPVLRPEHAEGAFARLIEQQTAKVPSHWFLVGAFGAMCLSLVLELSGRSRASRFVGSWPTPLLIGGIYNKLVKTLGTR